MFNQGDAWNTIRRNNFIWWRYTPHVIIWIPSLKQDPGIMYTQQSPNKFHPGCQWFWGKLFRQRTRPTPQSSTGRQVKSHHRLEGKTLHWNITSVGLWKRHSPYIHARICTRSTPLVSTKETKTTTRFTIPLNPSYLWKEQPDAEWEKTAEELDESNQKQL